MTQYFNSLESRSCKRNSYLIQIIFSNNSSESLPYLITLLAHELVHAKSYRKKLPLKDDKVFYPFLIVEEAQAFDHQLETFVELAKKNPNFYCNWAVNTWSYGDIVVPLSWVMNSMETEMRSGNYIYQYATEGNYKDKTYLLNSSKTDLRPDIKDQIRKLNLRYVK